MFRLWGYRIGEFSLHSSRRSGPRQSPTSGSSHRSDRRAPGRRVPSPVAFAHLQMPAFEALRDWTRMRRLTVGTSRAVSGRLADFGHIHTHGPSVINYLGDCARR